MPLDTETLGSLRIERSSQSAEGGGKKLLVWGGGVALVLVAIVAAFFIFGGKTTEVTTVVAEAESSGPSLGNAVLNASGYVVARRMATVSRARSRRSSSRKACRSRRIRCSRASIR